MKQPTLADRILKRALARAGASKAKAREAFTPTEPPAGAYDDTFRRLEDRLRPTPSPATIPDPPA